MTITRKANREEKSKIVVNINTPLPHCKKKKKIKNTINKWVFSQLKLTDFSC